MIENKKVFSAIIVLFATGMIISFSGCSGSKSAASHTYKAPGYVKKDYKQIMVFARVADDGIRHQAENIMVETLIAEGFKAIPAYKNLEVSYKYDSVAFLKRINELQVDAIITLEYLGRTTSLSETYTYNGGFYNMMDPSGGPYTYDTRSEKQNYVRADFYNLDSRNTQWNTILSLSQKSAGNSYAEALRRLSEGFLKKMHYDQIL